MILKCRLTGEGLGCESGVALAPWDKRAYDDGEVPSRISHGASLPPHSKTRWICERVSSKQQTFWTAPAERSGDDVSQTKSLLEKSPRLTGRNDSAGATPGSSADRSNF